MIDLYWSRCASKGAPGAWVDHAANLWRTQSTSLREFRTGTIDACVLPTRIAPYGNLDVYVAPFGGST